MSYDPDARDDEDPRADTGYVPAPKPARPPNLPGRGPCGDCDAGYDTRDAVNPWERGVPLYQRPRSTGEGAARRVICAGCVGKANRAHADRAEKAVRNLKASSVTGDSQAEREDLLELASLVGKDQADQTAAAIRQARDEKPAKGARR